MFCFNDISLDVIVVSAAVHYFLQVSETLSDVNNGLKEMQCRGPGSNNLTADE